MSAAQGGLSEKLDEIAKVITALEMPIPDGLIRLSPVARAHLILSMPIPPEKCEFRRLRMASSEVLSESFASNFDTFRKECERHVANPEALDAFLAANKMDIGVWVSTAIDGVANDESRATKLTKFIDTLRVGVTGLIERDATMMSVFGPMQLLETMRPLIRKLVEITEACSTTYMTAKKYIANVTTVLKDLDKIIEQAIEETDGLLLIKASAKFMSIHETFRQFACFSPALQRVCREHEVNSTVSEMMYFLDRIVALRNAVGPVESSSGNVSSAAAMTVKLLNEIVEIAGGSPGIDKLIEAFREISTVYSNPTAVDETMSQNVGDFVTHVVMEMEGVAALVAMAHGQLANALIVSFWQTITAVFGLQFKKNGKYGPNPEAVFQKIDLGADIGKADSAITARMLVKESETPVCSFEEVMKSFVNPSRKGKGLDGYTDYDRGDMVVQVLEARKATISELEVYGWNVWRQLHSLARELLMLGYAVDKFQPNDELAELYRDCVVVLNAKLTEFEAVKCFQIKEFTIDMAVNALVWVLSHSIERLETLVSNGGDATICRPVIAKLGRLNTGYQAIQEGDMELNLVMMGDSLNSDLEVLKEFAKDAKKFDHATRDCYMRLFSRRAVELLTVIRDRTSERCEKGYPVEEIVQAMLSGIGNARRVSQLLTYGQYSGASSDLLVVIASVIKSVSVMMTMLPITERKDIIAVAKKFRAAINGFPSVALKVVNAGECAKIVDDVQLIYWKLTHSDVLYARDDKVIALLEKARDGLETAKESVDDAGKGTYADIQQKISNELADWLTTRKARTGEEASKLIKEAGLMIRKITGTAKDTMSEETKQLLDNIRDDLNGVIIALGGRPLDLVPLVDKGSAYRGTILETYHRVAIRHVRDENIFHKEAKEALKIEIPQDVIHLQRCLGTLNSFIGSAEIHPSDFQAKMSIPILWFLTASKGWLYPQKERDDFIDCVVKFQTDESQTVDQLLPLCFRMLHHFHKIYDKCSPQSIKQKAGVAALLLDNYEKRANHTLADVVYYTGEFIKMIPVDDRPIFEVLLEPLQDCFHCRKAVHTVDCREAIMYLKGKPPDAVRKPNEATHGIVARKRSDNRRSFGGGVEWDLEQSETRPAGTPPPGFGMRGRRQAGLGDLENPIMVTVREVGGDPMWKPFLLAHIPPEKKITSEQKKAQGDAAWAKAIEKNMMVYEGNPVTKSPTQFRNIKLTNEFSLPREDVRSGNSLDLDAVAHIIWDVSNSRRVITFPCRILTFCFKSKYNAAKLKVPEGKIDLKESDVHPAFAALKKAKIGEDVKKLDPASVSGANIEKIIPAVCRLIELASPFNIGLLVALLAGCSERDLQGVVDPWIYVVFDPLKMSKNVFCRFLNGTAAYIRSALKRDPKRSEKETEANKEKLTSLLLTTDYIIRIAKVMVITKAAKKQNKVRVLSTNDRASAVSNFIDATSRVVGAFANYENSVFVNSELINFMEVAAPYCDPTCMGNDYARYIRRIQNEVPVDLTPAPKKGEAPDPKLPPKINKTVPHLRLIMTSIHYFANILEFVRTLGSADSEAFDAMAELYMAVFDSGIDAFITRAVVAFSEYVRWVEILAGSKFSHEDVVEISTALIPFLDTMPKAMDCALLRTDKSVFEHYLPLVMQIMRGAAHARLNEYMQSLGEEGQVRMFRALRTSIEYVLTSPKVPETRELLKDCTDLNDELNRLRSLKDVTWHELNYGLYREISYRAMSLIVASSLSRLPPKTLTEVARLMTDLMNHHQDRSMFGFICATISKFIDGSGAAMFNPQCLAVPLLVTACFRLLQHRLIVARSSAVTLLVHICYTNFIYTKRIELASSSILGLFTKTIMSCPSYNIELVANTSFMIRKILRFFIRPPFLNLTETMCQSLDLLSTSLQKVRVALSSDDTNVLKVLTDGAVKIPVRSPARRVYIAVANDVAASLGNTDFKLE